MGTGSHNTATHSRVKLPCFQAAYQSRLRHYQPTKVGSEPRQNINASRAHNRRQGGKRVSDSHRLVGLDLQSSDVKLGIVGRAPDNLCCPSQAGIDSLLGAS